MIFLNSDKMIFFVLFFAAIGFGTVARFKSGGGNDTSFLFEYGGVLLGFVLGVYWTKIRKTRSK